MFRFFLILCCCNPFLQTVCQGLVAFYPFDNSPKDLSGNLNDGIIHGKVTPTMDRFGNPCGAYRFDGSSAYIEVPNSPSLESPANAFTFTTWYRFDKKRENQWLTAICKGATNNELPENPQYRVQVQQNIAAILNSCSPGFPSRSSTISVTTDFTKCDPQFQNHMFEAFTWSFFALVFTGQKVITYMNNNKVFESDYNTPFTKNQSSLYIGMDEPGITEFFEGSLDDIYIYNRALDDQELQKLFNEKRTARWFEEEFQMTIPENKIITLNKNECKIKVDFGNPNITNTACGNVVVNQISGLPSGSDFAVGKHLISFEAVSSSGYEQHFSFYIIVKDIIPPTLVVPKDTILYVRKGESGIRFPYRQPSATDNCGIKTLDLVSGPASNDFVSVKKHIVRYKATDVNENSATKEFSIEVKQDSDHLKPPPADIMVASVPKPETKKPISRSAKKDTLIVRDSLSLYIPADLKTRVNKEQKYIEVESDLLKGTLYDNGVYDGDTVSIFWNKKIVVYKQEINIKGTSFDLSIDTSADNELTMYAENLGKIPPNTALLVLYDGNKRYEINLSSTLKTNGIIKIRKKK